MAENLTLEELSATGSSGKSVTDSNGIEATESASKRTKTNRNRKKTQWFGDRNETNDDALFEEIQSQIDNEIAGIDIEIAESASTECVVNTATKDRLEKRFYCSI